MDDYSLLSLLEYLSSARELVELELHVYGNLFSNQVLRLLIDCVKELSLKKFVLSLFEFSHQENEDSYRELIEAFNDLDIEQKKLL